MEDIYRSRSDSFHESEPLFSSDPSGAAGLSNAKNTIYQLRWVVIAPWALCLGLMCGIIAQYTLLSDPSRCYWASSELDIAKRELVPTRKRIRFTGGLRYNESKQLYRQIEPGAPDYAGFPTPEIDAAWDQLISSTDIFMTVKEVQENINRQGPFADLPVGDRLYTDPLTGLYQSVPSVFHDLHCLNKIRRAVYIDHYPQDIGDIYWAHTQHCIDTLRQSIMCYGDLTPIPEAYTDWRPSGYLEPIFQIHHTCRDFKDIQRWAKRRDSLDEAVWRQNAERLKSDVFS